MKKLINFQLVNSSLEELMDWVETCEVVSIDTETTGNFDDMFDRRIVMLQLGDNHVQYMVDCRTDDPTPVIKRLIERNVLLVGHNIKFDYTVIKLNYGLEIENVFDTMLACQLVEYGDKNSGLIRSKLKNAKKKYTLEACVQRHVSPMYYSKQGNLFAPVITKQIREGFARIGNSDFSYEQQWYGLYDVLTCFLLYKKLSVIIEEHSLVAAVEQENEFLKVAADCEINGMPLDTQKWLDASTIARAETVELLAKLKEVADINWDSPKQVNQVLKGLGVDTLILDKKTGEVKESVGKIQLQKQAARFPILELYISYKIQDKKCKAYGEKFLRHVNPQSGRIHTSLLQLKDTGRTGSSGPNMQNIPRDKAFRYAFTTGEDSSFVIADFSN